MTIEAPESPGTRYLAAGGKAPADARRSLALSPAEAGAAGSDSKLGFADFLDVINPLQHIPVVSSIYRRLTGDEITAPARILGGALFGGPIGFIASIINTLVHEISGRDIGETALAMVFGPKGKDPGSPDPNDAALAERPAPQAPISSDARPDTRPQVAQAVPGVVPNSDAFAGQDALRALALDLHAGATTATGPSGADGRAAVPAHPDEDPRFADRMLLALDKYEAMVRQRDQSRPERGRLIEGVY